MYSSSSACCHSCAARDSHSTADIAAHVTRTCRISESGCHELTFRFANGYRVWRRGFALCAFIDRLLAVGVVSGGSAGR